MIGRDEKGGFMSQVVATSTISPALVCNSRVDTLLRAITLRTGKGEKVPFKPMSYTEYLAHIAKVGKEMIELIKNTIQP